jgi:hypothetical protein
MLSKIPAGTEEKERPRYGSPRFAGRIGVWYPSCMASFPRLPRSRRDSAEASVYSRPSAEAADLVNPTDETRRAPSGRGQLGRRGFLATSAAAVAASSLVSTTARAAGKATAATPPAGFTPMNMPGKIVKVSKANTLQPNGLWPKEDVAKQMLERVMTELTGEASLEKAVARFFHKDDKVAIKVNGIAGQKGQTMATNKELVLPFIDALLAMGIPPANVWVYEQYYMTGCRIDDKNLPKGVKCYNHGNGQATMDDIVVGGIKTKFTKYLTDATAVANFSLIKDHGICGYTGLLKNMTHGSNINPQDFHAHTAAPQIAHLYAQDAIKSRVRLNITDGYKIMYEGGPIDRRPDCRPPHEAIYACTDPVAMDTLGYHLVDKLRQEKGMKTLADAKRAASYIQQAAELGLGVGKLDDVRLREVAILRRRLRMLRSLDLSTPHRRRPPLGSLEPRLQHDAPAAQTTARRATDPDHGLGEGARR